MPTAMTAAVVRSATAPAMSDRFIGFPSRSGAGRLFEGGSGREPDGVGVVTATSRGEVAAEGDEPDSAGVDGQADQGVGPRDGLRVLGVGGGIAADPFAGQLVGWNVNAIECTAAQVSTTFHNGQRGNLTSVRPSRVSGGAKTADTRPSTRIAR